MNLVPANYMASPPAAAASQIDQRQAIGNTQSSLNSSGGGGGSKSRANNTCQQFTVSGAGIATSSSPARSLEKTPVQSWKELSSGAGVGDPIRASIKTCTLFNNKNLPINFNNSINNSYSWCGNNNSTNHMNFIKHDHNDDGRNVIANDDDDKRKVAELSIIHLVEQSTLAAAEEGKVELALAKAREAIERFDSLKSAIISQEKSRSANPQVATVAAAASKSLASVTNQMTRGVSLYELSIMVEANLAAQMKNNGQLEESIELYTQLCRLAAGSMSSGSLAIASISSSSPNQHNSSQSSDARFILYRFGINIGNLYYELGEYQQALKYYRLTLDRLSTTGNHHKNLKIKLMNNISVALLAAEQLPETISSLNLLLTDNLSHNHQVKYVSSSSQEEVSATRIHNSNHHRFGLNLMVCHYQRNDLRSMMVTFENLVKVNICHHYEQTMTAHPTKSKSSGCNRHPNLVRDNNDAANHDESGFKPSGRLPSSSARSHSNEISVKQANNAHNTELSSSVFGQDTNDERASSTTTTLTTTSSDWTLTVLDGEQDVHRRAQHEDGLLTMNNDRESTDRQLLMSDITDENILEAMIGRKHIQISRCLIMSCNLMMDLDMQLSGNKSSLLTFCEKVLNDSEFYKALVYDLKVNSVADLVKSKHKLSEVITLLADIVLKQGAYQQDASKSKRSSATGAKSANMIDLSPVIASYSCLFHLLKSNLEAARRYGKSALKFDRFNVQALINLGNCYYLMKEFKTAEVFYRRTLKVNPSCWEAHHNLGLVNRKLGRSYDELNQTPESFFNLEMQSFSPSMSPNMILFAVQLALIHKNSGQGSKTLTISNQLSSNSKLAPDVRFFALKLLDETSTSNPRKSSDIDLLQQINDEHPYFIPVSERLIALSIQNFNYQAAKKLLTSCIVNRPDQVKWFQMLAECHRRAADYNLAIATYKVAIDSFPQDTNCLKNLIKLTDELGLKSEKLIYESKLEKVTKLSI